ncbi:MAG: hypothetical protein J6S53_00200 [Lentisphaeria bacterium]|nr:hypothetical protein [Lentisphaeria bacterium]
MLKIYVPEKKGIFKIVSEEFVSFYSRMTGEKPQIVTKPSAKEDMVVIGSDTVNAYTHSKIIEKVIPQFSIVTNQDDYQIVSAKDNGRKLLFFAGGRDRALLYALYHFFELQGCRYFWDGDIVPEKKNLKLDGYNIKESPRFQYRGLRYFAHRSLKRFQAEHWDIDDWKKELDWCLTKRFNLFMLRIGLDDIFQKAFPDVVKYPKWHVPESKERSYDDRDLFWSLEYRGKLRKMVLEYARERDLMHPEDLGTMTHWYSRTPHDFLNHFNPDFMPQATAGYSQKTGLVWDIRQDHNLDNYFKLTEAHIENYGSPELFHTIGLAERRCYADREANHQMKLYTYRRIIHKLRGKYPNAPLLIASWDFCMYWKPEEIHAFLQELDPTNTIILEYTSETDNELNNFTNWNMMGRFPWIFGIFHAFEPNTDVRGYYDITERRLHVAKDDPMCKGMVFWPECSHTDTLMLEYLGANSWNPADSTRKIASFIDKFVSDRYPVNTSVMRKIWQKFLPIIKMRGFVGPQQPHSFMIGENPFRVYDSFKWNIAGTPCAATLGYQEKFITDFAPVMKEMPALLKMLAKLDHAKMDEFTRRDVVDIARSCAGRCLHYGLYHMNFAYDKWRKNEGKAETVKGIIAFVDKIYHILSDILASHEDYSLNDTLKEMQTKHECNPDFEFTLKGNAENSYCRSYIYELVKPLYIPEFRIVAGAMLDAMRAGNKGAFQSNDEKYKDMAIKIADKFYDAPLAKNKPDHIKAFKALPSTLKTLADEVEKYMAGKSSSEEVDAFIKSAKL